MDALLVLARKLQVGFLRKLRIEDDHFVFGGSEAYVNAGSQNWESIYLHSELVVSPPQLAAPTPAKREATNHTVFDQILSFPTDAV